MFGCIRPNLTVHFVYLPCLCTAALDSSGSSKRGSSEAVAPAALLSKSGREVYVAQQQSSKGFLLVYDLNSKQLLDIVKVRVHTGTRAGCGLRGVSRLCQDKQALKQGARQLMAACNKVALMRSGCRLHQSNLCMLSSAVWYLVTRPCGRGA